jgi:hypothetical protein
MYFIFIPRHHPGKYYTKFHCIGEKQLIMKAFINNKHNKVCMKVGYYDENGAYREETYENLPLKEIHKSIRRNIYLDHDITLHVVPGIEARMFARSLKDIETLLEIKQKPDFIKRMFDAWSKYNQSENGEYIYTTIDLEEERELAESFRDVS